MGVEADYQSRVQALIQELRVARKLSYKQLAARLEQLGFVLEHRALANRINRGTFSAGFALLVLEALETSSLRYPKPPKRLSAE